MPDNNNIPILGLSVQEVAGITPPLPPTEPASVPANDAPDVIKYRVKTNPSHKEEIEEPVAINEHNDDPELTYCDSKESHIAIVKKKS